MSYHGWFPVYIPLGGYKRPELGSCENPLSGIFSCAKREVEAGMTVTVTQPEGQAFMAETKVSATSYTAAELEILGELQWLSGRLDAMKEKPKPSPSIPARQILMRFAVIVAWILAWIWVYSWTQTIMLEDYQRALNGTVGLIGTSGLCALVAWATKAVVEAA